MNTITSRPILSRLPQNWAADRVGIYLGYELREPQLISEILYLNSSPTSLENDGAFIIIGDDPDNIENNAAITKLQNYLRVTDGRYTIDPPIRASFVAVAKLPPYESIITQSISFRALRVYTTPREEVTIAWQGE